MVALLKKIARFETYHRILVFSALIVGTIAFIRISVQFWNPNPMLFDIELHHFDYGVILLLFTSNLLLFGNARHKNLYLVFASIGSALIIDGYLALRLSVQENHDGALDVYNDTVGPVVLTVVIITLVALFVKAVLTKHYSRYSK